MKLSIKLSWGMKDTKNAAIYDCSTLKYVSDRFRDWLMLKRLKAARKHHIPLSVA